MLDVNFSFFDPQPQDYHSIKLLLSQLLGHVDAATGDLDLAGVTDLVLEQKLVGSTVKTDSGEDDDKANEGDPYAVLTVLNLNVHKVSLYPVLLERGDFAFSLSLARCGFCIHTEISLPPHQDKPAISSLIKYLLSKLDSPASSAFHAQLSALLQNPVGEEAEAKKQQHVGLVLSERMVNMPTQIVPPMYRMLQEELQWAVEDVSVPVNPAQNSPVTAVFLETARFADFAISSVVHPSQKEPYNFSHLLFLSRVFLSSTAALEDDPNAALEQAIVAEAGLRSSQVAAPKKKKQRKGATKDERDDEKIWMYHPEDEFIQKVRVFGRRRVSSRCLSFRR